MELFHTDTDYSTLVISREIIFEVFQPSNHRCHKLRTDGGYAQVRELGSIVLFVVTSLKVNQLPPNFEHKFPIMYGILTANFYAL